MLMKERTYASLFLLSGLMAHLLTALFSYGAHHSDELFQVFEFAGYKLGLNRAEDLPWEFHNRMRSGLLPLLVFSFTRFFNFLSLTNPFVIATLLRICVSFTAFVALFKLIKHFYPKSTPNNSLNLAYFLAGLFWLLPYFHARLLSENVASVFFMFGFSIVLKLMNEPFHAFKFVLAGLLLGFSFICRFQMSFMIAGLFFWMLLVQKVSIKTICLFISGIVLALVIGLYIDFWLYHEYTLSWWNYLNLNLFQHAAANFGEQSVYFYVTETLSLMLPPLSVLIIGAIIGFWILYPKNSLTWISLPFILLHFFTAHKELRFLFPVINFLPLFIPFVFLQIEKQYHSLYSFFLKKTVWVSLLLVNSIALFSLMFVPADNVSLILKKMYDFTKNKEALLVYDENNPYDNKGSLNYFKNPNITSLHRSTWNDSLAQSVPVYYFTEHFLVSDNLRIKNKDFECVYTKFPGWMVHFNVNHWLDRATFEIYKQKQSEP